MAEIQRRAPSAVSVVGAAFRVVEWQLGLARELILLPARVLALLDDVEVVVERIQDLLDEVNRTVRAIDGIVASATSTVDDVRTTVARADRMIDQVAGTVTDAEGVVRRVDGTIDSAEGVVARVGATVDTADELVLDAGPLIERVVPLIDFADSALAPVKPVVEALLVDAELDPEVARRVATRLTEVLVWADKTVSLLEPIADEVLESVDPEEIKAVVKFIDHLPALGESLETDIMPVLASMDTVAPEVHQILEVAQQCLEAVAGIPGFQLLRRRGGENGRTPT
ncbi:methyl-accepting chemotaxis protein [Dietzia cinnamea]|uniref:methyl-accepting chemotaxis protein n=1 Tax=Dietzia cinnamea TaxID=321318 RepID=UPI0021A85CE7|nr:methyl-accepting chemotaxis protein [Dietzia cinnamea]MCT2057212.1 methyl-accepting chemotaxis protein [Dietzia cinnamea]MCT2120124.1 methyl-accepting chemotaxis protein [Dietzia cinnamea]MCT2144034.1 methyl-accepting chemotaxis protein [Dietzia cinnamea]MCT2303297.1 methyl-accepting chemotaxis protein [Dietzia cinnamea]